MTTFWSWYVTILTLGTLFMLVWLVIGTRKNEQHKNVENKVVGHSFDGIEEYDNPLPKWWFILFLLTVVFALGYLVLYPGLGNWKGIFPGHEGWTGVHQWEKEMAKAAAKYDPIYAKFAAMPIPEVAQNEQALKIGGRLFASNCAACHGSDARGAFGFPNLTDTEWRWGGKPETIKQTILNGREATMPAHGPIIGDKGVHNVAAYVLTQLAGRKLPEKEKADIAAGQKIFSTTCFVCHGADGKGTPSLGAPNLTNPSAFLYGTSYAQLQQTIRYGRHGQMPAQKDFLGKNRVHVLAAYVYSLSHPNAKTSK
ncbi:UNVERIFIED_CONTAM: hypothetical protein GTU68_008597 [Idotea baltica]|nr:hypothetical protein [Idotea baltica]